MMWGMLILAALAAAMSGVLGWLNMRDPDDFNLFELVMAAMCGLFAVIVAGLILLGYM